MPILSNIRDVVIHGSQLTDITNNLSISTGIDTLLAASCPEATYDSSNRAYSFRYFPGTHEQFIEDIIRWAIPIAGDTTPVPIYRMKGPAGVGKSTIAQTCAESLKGLEKLGAGYFFSIGRRDKAEKFFPSIAYQLSTVHPAYRDLLDVRIRRDRTIVNKAMAFQFRDLIDEPLRELEAQGKGIGKRLTVIIDGLNECEGVGAQCEIIRIIGASVTAGALPLCWAFFGRPDPHIEAMFSRTIIDHHCHTVILPISREADEEVELYLRRGFEIIIRHCDSLMQSQWPSAEDIQTIVGAANGSFIYARTVLRFVGHLDKFGPQERLQIIIDSILGRHKHDLHAGTSIGTPFAELDAFYTLTLQSIPTEIFPSIHLLLGFLCKAGGLTWSAITTANLLNLSKGEFQTICNHVNAVVHFRDPGKDLELDPTIDTNCVYTRTSPEVIAKILLQVSRDLGGTVSFYHKAFEDFLLDPIRSGSYCTKGSEAIEQHYTKLDIETDRCFHWDGSELALTPGVLESTSSLSYPYTNKLVNSLVKALICYRIPGNNSHRKHLYIVTHLLSIPRTGTHRVKTGVGLIWGCKYHFKTYPGTRLRLISRDEFFKLNINTLRSGMKAVQRVVKCILKPYHPNLTSRVKYFFCIKARGNIESGLLRMRRGENSTFWYWEINHELQYYRDFHTTHLEMGKKVFQDEDFDSWPVDEFNSD